MAASMFSNEEFSLKYTSNRSGFYGNGTFPSDFVSLGQKDEGRWNKFSLDVENDEEKGRNQETLNESAEQQVKNRP